MQNPPGGPNQKGAQGWPPASAPVTPPQAGYPQHGYPQQGQPVQQPYGAPPQAGYQSPNQPQPSLGQPPSGTAAQDLTGFELQPGERLLHFARRSYTSEVVSAWILGVLFAPLLFGFFFIYQAVTLEKKNPKAFGVTTRRFVVIGPNGEVTSYWHEHYNDVEPTRHQVRAGGGGLIGLAVAAAVSAGLNALASRNEKENPAYWARTSAFNFIRRDNGQKITIPATQAEGQTFGPILAKAIISGIAEQLPSMDPRYLQSLPASPGKPGTALVVLGVVLFVLGFGPLLFGADGVGCSGFDNPAKFVGLLLGMVLTGGGIGLTLLGAWKRAAIRPATGAQQAPTAAKKFHPLMILPVVLFAFGYGVSGCWGIKEAVRCGEIHERYGPKPKSTTPTTTSTSASTAKADFMSEPAMSPDRIDKLLAAEGYTVDKRTSSSEWAKVPSISWEAKHPSAGRLNVTWYDFSVDQPQKMFSIGAQHVAITEVTGAASNVQAGYEVGDAVARKPPNGSKDVAAAMQSVGWKPDKVPAKDFTFIGGCRTLLLFGKKASASVVLNVLDCTAAAAQKDNSALIIQDKRLVVLAGSKTGGDPAALAKKVGAR